MRNVRYRSFIRFAAPVLAVVTALAMAVIAVPTAFTQTARVGAQIVWMDNIDQVIIHDAAGKSVQADFGVMLEPGATIQTKNSGAELTLVPNGTAIALDRNTTFRIDGLSGSAAAPASKDNTFSLLVGKLRMAAAQNTGSTYSVRTATTVAGVRGTDFYRAYDPAQTIDWLCVTKGAVQLDANSGSQGVLVQAGSFVNLNNGFVTAQPDAAWLQSHLTLENVHRAVLPPHD